MPSVGDLYVNLGIKGSDKTVGQLADTKKGMGELASMSIEAKAAILATAYAFEQMIATSAKLAQTTVNASTILGLPPSTIDRYHQAGLEVGATNEDIIASFKSLQGISASLKVGGNLPQGLQVIADKVGDFSERLKKGDLEYAFQKIQKFATGNTAKDLKALWLSIFPPTVISGMEKNVFSPDKLSKIKPIEDKTFENAARAQAELEKLKYDISTMFMQFTAAHGAEIVAGMREFIPPLIALTNAIADLATNMKLFLTLKESMKGTADFIGAVSDTVKDVSDTTTGKKSIGETAKNTGTRAYHGLQTYVDNIDKVGVYVSDKIKSSFKHVYQGVVGGEAVAPEMKPETGGETSVNQSNSFNIHVKDPNDAEPIISKVRDVNQQALDYTKTSRTQTESH